MFTIDLTGVDVLITGGTQGIGLASALRFAEAGAQTILTYKWGTADEEALMKHFDGVGGKRPYLFQTDVSVEEDTGELLNAIREKGIKKIDIFISNVGFSLKTPSFDDYKKRSLYKTFDYSTWPLVDYTRKIKKIFGKYPTRILGISSDGPDHFYPGYDFVAASKSLLEFFARYMASHLLPEGCRVNIVRFGTVKTDSFKQIFGEEYFKFAEEHGVTEETQLSPDECGKSVMALCSGLLDAMNGQILHIDYGLPFRDNLMNHYQTFKDKKGANE